LSFDDCDTLGKLLLWLASAPCMDGSSRSSSAMAMLESPMNSEASVTSAECTGAPAGRDGVEGGRTPATLVRRGFAVLTPTAVGNVAPAALLVSCNGLTSTAPATGAATWTRVVGLTVAAVKMAPRAASSFIADEDEAATRTRSKDVRSCQWTHCNKGQPGQDSRAVTQRTRERSGQYRHGDRTFPASA
jgi:hypothetical protein